MKSDVVKIFILALVFLGLTLSVNAQEKKVEFGVKAGLNLSSMGGDNEGAKIRPGVNAGVTLDCNFTPNVSLLTGLEYSLKGVNVEGGDANISLSYLQIPIHIGYKLAVSEQAKLVFHAGPYLAYGVDGKMNLGGLSVDAFSINGQKILERFDVGVGLGVKAEFGRFSLGLGADMGFSNLVSDNIKNISKNTPGMPSDGTLTNRNIYLSAGIKF